jgi:hypothetical protein
MQQFLQTKAGSAAPGAKNRKSASSLLFQPFLPRKVRRMAFCKI